MKRPPLTPRARRGGYTLVEVMVAVPLAVLLMGGAMDLFLTCARTSSKTSAQMSATQDAANAVQQIVETAREAQGFVLPDEAGFVPKPGTQAASYSTTLNGETICTAIEITAPPALLPATVGYPNSPLPSVSSLTSIAVKDTQGNTLTLPATASPAFAPYDCNGTASQQVLIYRADGDGTPDPAAGGFLWEASLPGSPVSVSQALCRTVATGAPDAVQFLRPFENGATQPYQVEVKVISGAYSGINGVQTSEETNGTYTSQLVGKCVWMRDHGTQPAAALSGGAHPVTFQAN